MSTKIFVGDEDVTDKVEAIMFPTTAAPAWPTYVAVEPTTITDVLIDGKKLRRSQWYLKDGTLRFDPAVSVTNGQTISVEMTEGGDNWQFGDILTFREPPHDAKFMYLADNEDDGADDPIWVMSLFATRDGWTPGHITTRNRSIFERVEFER